MACDPTTPDELKAVQRFREEVCERSETIDPKQEYEWYELSIGFFLACGLSRDSAVNMAAYARYDQHYWQDDT